ncbi:Metallo-dependent phosphatase, partial [Rhizoctonia solani]
MLIADPQVIDHRSYPGRPTWLKVLTQFIVDSNLRKSWKAAKRLSPDIIIFLGDMMDGGRYRMLDDEYESYYARFNDIFQTRNGTQKYYLVGNHDVGLGSNKAFSVKARQRYLSHFGQTNYQVPVANHSLVFIDAPGLVEEDYVRYEQDEAFEDWTGMPGGTIEYVNRLAQEANPRPRILFTHIPLSRSALATCGPLRERGSIQRGAGVGYQNLLGRHTSQFLLDNIKPLVVFSGDDHDYCEVRHPIGEDSGQTVREISVKSFSMAMGIRRPGFQLLSLVAPDPSSPYRQTFADTPCHLPDQMHIYTHVYAIFGFISILVLSYLNAKQPKTKNRPAELGLLKVPQRGPGVPLLRSASLNVPSPRVLRSRPMTPIGSPMIPSSPVLFAATVDDEDEISYPPSPNTAPMTPGSFFDLGEDHTFSLPSPVMTSDSQKRKSFWTRTKERKRPGWSEARHQPWYNSLRNLFDLIGCSSLCSGSQQRGFVGRLVVDFGSCAWPPVANPSLQRPELTIVREHPELRICFSSSLGSIAAIYNPADCRDGVSPGSDRQHVVSDLHLDIELVFRVLTFDSIDVNVKCRLSREWVQCKPCNVYVHRYRPMNSADIPRVKDMHHNILKSSSTAAMLRQSLFHLHRRTFVAFIPAKPSPNRTATKPLIIGFATAHIALHGLDIPPEITVVNVAVDTLYRRHGIGENLIRAVTASLLMSATARRPAEGDALVSVELRERNPVVGYFQKLGWEKEEVRRTLTRWGKSF